jgi:hypothetical protein
VSENRTVTKIKKHSSSSQANQNMKLASSTNLQSGINDSGDASSVWYDMMKELKRTISEGPHTNHSIIEDKKSDLVSPNQ